MTLIFAFGLVFQLPVVLTLLARAGMITAETLTSRRRWAIVIAFIVAAVLTPPDPISQISLAIPTIAALRALHPLGALCRAAAPPRGGAAPGRGRRRRRGVSLPVSAVPGAADLEPRAAHVLVDEPGEQHDHEPDLLHEKPAVVAVSSEACRPWRRDCKPYFSSSSRLCRSMTLARASSRSSGNRPSSCRV